MDPNVAMTIDKLPDSGGAMGGEIICDNVDLLALRKAGHDLFQKSNKFRTGVTRRGLAEHLAGFGVERGVERKGAVTVVLKTVSLGSSGRERQHGIESVQSLDGALFVDAEDSRIDRRLQIQANDISSLGFKIRGRRWPCSGEGGGAAVRLWPEHGLLAYGWCQVRPPTSEYSSASSHPWVSVGPQPKSELPAWRSVGWLPCHGDD